MLNDLSLIRINCQLTRFQIAPVVETVVFGGRLDGCAVKIQRIGCHVVPRRRQRLVMRIDSGDRRQVGRPVTRKLVPIENVLYAEFQSGSRMLLLLRSAGRRRADHRRAAGRIGGALLDH